MSKALIPRDASTLVLVDYQQRLMPAIHQADLLLADAQCLADVAALLGVRTVGTEQNPAGLGPNVAALRQRCSTTLAKRHFDACADGLLELLWPASPPPSAANTPALPPDLVLAGCEAHVCLMQTGLGLLRAGFTVWVVASACGARSPDDHALAMQRLRAAGAQIVGMEMVLFEWLQTCDHPQFKAVLQRLKARDSQRHQLSSTA
jgi:hypothetical protein